MSFSWSRSPSWSIGMAYICYVCMNALCVCGVVWCCRRCRAPRARARALDPRRPDGTQEACGCVGGWFESKGRETTCVSVWSLLLRSTRARPDRPIDLDGSIEAARSARCLLLPTENSEGGSR